MIAGTTLTPPSFAACWVTPVEGPWAVLGEVSESPSRGLFLGVPEWRVDNA